MINGLCFALQLKASWDSVSAGLQLPRATLHGKDASGSVLLLKIFLFTAFAIGKSLQLKYDESLKRKYWQEKQFIIWMSLDFFPSVLLPRTLLVLFPVTDANSELKEVFNSLP